MVYLKEDKDDGPDKEDDEVADESFSGEPRHRSWSSNFHYNEGEAKSLHSASKSENQGEFAITEEEIRDDHDHSQDSPGNTVRFFYILHYVEKIINTTSKFRKYFPSSI